MNLYIILYVYIYHIYIYIYQCRYICGCKHHVIEMHRNRLCVPCWSTWASVCTLRINVGHCFQSCQHVSAMSLVTPVPLDDVKHIFQTCLKLRNAVGLHHRREHQARLVVWCCHVCGFSLKILGFSRFLCEICEEGSWGSMLLAQLERCSSHLLIKAMPDRCHVALDANHLKVFWASGNCTWRWELHMLKISWAWCNFWRQMNTGGRGTRGAMSLN